jgi:hypothetical protein
VGVGKRRYLEPELGKGTVDLMRTIKKAVDPNDIMNPGKVCIHRHELSYQAKRINYISIIAVSTCVLRFRKLLYL